MASIIKIFETADKTYVSSKSAHNRNIDFSNIIEGFEAQLDANTVQMILMNLFQKIRLPTKKFAKLSQKTGKNCKLFNKCISTTFLN